MRRLATRAIFVFVLVLWPAGLCVSAQDAPLEEFHYGIAPGSDLTALARRGRVLGSKNFTFTDEASGERRLSGYGEYHAVYPATVEDLLSVLLDIPAYPDVLPMILEASLLETRGNHYVSRVSSGISLPGFKQIYTVTSEAVVERFPDGSVGLRSFLLHCEDEKLYEHYLSWYLEPVRINGQAMTYVRYFNRPGIRKPFPGLIVLIRLFADGNLRDQVESLAKEALRRSAD